jgi:hypothetical protein
VFAAGTSMSMVPMQPHYLPSLSPAIMFANDENVGIAYGMGRRPRKSRSSGKSRVRSRTSLPTSHMKALKAQQPGEFAEIPRLK